MSRMLKALQQIEARCEQPRPKDPPDGGDPPDASATFSSAEVEPQAEFDLPVAADSEPVDADESLFGVGSVEAALARVEAAAVLVDSQQPKVPSVEPTPVPWPGLRGGDHARAYGKLADRVVSQLGPDGGATLLFASPDDADARTEVLIPLAAALAERTPDKVLAVDGDPGGGTLSDRLGLSAARGTPDVLQGTIVWHQAIRRTTTPGLSVAAAAALGGWDAGRTNPSDVAHLLHELRGEYRIVLVDVALSHRGQLGLIGRYCDGAYLVVRLRQTTRRRLRKAAETIRACHARLLGSVVVDDWTRPAA